MHSARPAAGQLLNAAAQNAMHAGALCRQPLLRCSAPRQPPPAAAAAHMGLSLGHTRCFRYTATAGSRKGGGRGSLWRHGEAAAGRWGGCMWRDRGAQHAAARAAHSMHEPPAARLRRSRCYAARLTVNGDDKVVKASRGAQQQAQQEGERVAGRLAALLGLGAQRQRRRPRLHAHGAAATR